MLKYKIIASLVAIVVLAVVAEKIVFTTSTVAIRSDPKKIFVNSSSPVKVTVVPLNRLGFNVPFDRLNGKFVVRDGVDKIRVEKVMNNGLVFAPGHIAGRVVILYYAANLAFPVEIVLRIESAAVASADSTSFSHS